MRKFWVFFILLFAVPALSQVTVTGTVTDSDTIAWANGSVTFSLKNGGGAPKLNGVPMTPAQLTIVAPLNSTGQFSTALSNNTQITPVGTQWGYQICPAATSPCQNFTSFTASGSSVSLTTAISSQIQPIRIPAAYNTQAYSDVEISPIPPPGGTYYNLTSSAIKFWNGLIWQIMGSGGGGGATPSAPANSIQLANSGVTNLTSDADFLINPTTHTMTVTANMVINALSLVPGNVYDPMNTQFNGGLAAAIAGTSGFTPTQVIQAAVDYGECQFQTGAVTSGMIKIPLPPLAMNIGQILIWGSVDIGGASITNAPNFRHTDQTKAMIAQHANTDTITCNSTVYTPAGSGTNDYIHNIGVSGLGPLGTGNQDIAIWINGQSNTVWQITGVGSSFGSQVILEQGITNFIYYAGYPGAQLKGCQNYTNGNQNVSTSITSGICQSVEGNGTDSSMAFVYSTDAAEQQTGKGPGPCYPSCAAIGTGNNEEASFLFPQVSDVDLAVNGNNARITVVRADAASMEAIQMNGNGNTITNIQANGECLSSTLTTNYNAGTKTACYGIKDTGQANVIYGPMQISLGNTFFGQVQAECQIGATLTGASAVGGTYAGTNMPANPDSTTQNDKAYCGVMQGDTASAKIVYPSQPSYIANAGGTVNISGLTSVFINTTNPVTHITGGTPGQNVEFSGITGASIVPGTSGSETITTCNGLPEVFDGIRVVKFTNKGGYFSTSFGYNNQMRELCNNPQLTPLHVNYSGNPTVTNPSLIDVYGNIQTRQIPNPVLDVSQLHGSVISGQYCFVLQVTFSDTYSIVSSLSCTSVDLVHQTSGSVFITVLPQAPAASQYVLYLVSNSTGSGITLGAYPNPTVGGPTGLIYDGPTTIAAGGNGATPPTTAVNYTGFTLAPWGVLFNTYNNTQPPCDVTTRGRLWLVGGTGGNPDIYQGCFQVGASFIWSNLSLSSTSTAGFIPVTLGAGSFGNSHINETSNPGFETITQGLLVNDTSGNGLYGVGTEGTQPTGCTTGLDCLWADSTAHGWLINDNGNGNAFVVSEPSANTYTVGHCGQIGANGTLVDAGIPCAGGTPPGTPTVVADTGGAGTSPSASLVTSPPSSDFSGYVNITTGTCTGGICGTGQGVFTLTYSRTYTPALKCFVEAANNNALGLANNTQLSVPPGQLTTAHFVAISGAVGLPQSTAFVYYYHCDFQ